MTEIWTRSTCYACKGEGVVQPGVPCSVCEGTGFIEQWISIAQFFLTAEAELSGPEDIEPARRSARCRPAAKPREAS
jgi:RecJ-like exonuclease